MLVILDGSDSMNEQAGDGGTRLDAAKSALRELIDVVPEGAQVGLRVYGNKLSGVSRARAAATRPSSRRSGRSRRTGSARRSRASRARAGRRSAARC